MKLITRSQPALLVSNFQRSVPSWIIVAAGLGCVLLLFGVALRSLVFVLSYFSIYLENFSSSLDKMPRWVASLLGLFLLFLVVGIAGRYLYSMFEWFILWLAFGRTSLQADLWKHAKQDFGQSIKALERDHGLNRPFAVVAAIGLRGFKLSDLIRRLRNVERNRLPWHYRESINRLKKGWQDGADSAKLLRNAENLQRLLAPSIEERLLAQTVAANITYLCGSLLQGRRLADRTMAEAELCDRSGLPIYQWLASYPHANSRLFLGQFYDAALSLGKRWRHKFVSLPPDEQRLLFSELKDLSTVHPIASVPRHIILASAFAGKALRNNNTQPRAPSEPLLDNDEDWVDCWYETGLRLCKEEPIALNFTHGYMSLYYLVVMGSAEAAFTVLAEIPAGAAPAAKYVKDGMLGLCYLKGGKFAEALECFRRADRFALESGNTFMDGIFLPAHAAAAVRTHGVKDKEVDDVGRRARSRARQSQSAFYDSLVDAFGAVVAQTEQEEGKFKRLKSRAQWQPGGLVTIYGLDQLSAAN